MINLRHTKISKKLKFRYQNLTSSKWYLMRFLFIAFLNLFMNFLIITNLHNIKYHPAISIVDAIEPTMAWFLTIILHMLFLWFILWLLSYPTMFRRIHNS